MGYRIFGDVFTTVLKAFHSLFLLLILKSDAVWKFVKCDLLIATAHKYWVLNLQKTWIYEYIACRVRSPF